MSEFSDKSSEQLERLRRELALDQRPEAKIQLERLVAEQRRRHPRP